MYVPTKIRYEALNYFSFDILNCTLYIQFLLYQSYISAYTYIDSSKRSVMKFCYSICSSIYRNVYDAVRLKLYVMSNVLKIHQDHYYFFITVIVCRARRTPEVHLYSVPIWTYIYLQYITFFTSSRPSARQYFSIPYLQLCRPGIFFILYYFFTCINWKLLM